MDQEREEQVLNTGLEAAKAQLSQYKQRPEYPRDFNRLYEWLENKIFALYEAIYHRNYFDIYNTAGEVVIAASRIIEFAYNEIEWEKILPEEPEGGKDEVVDN